MSDNWVVQHLINTLNTWNEKLAEVWMLLTMSPEEFKGGGIWKVILSINGSLQAVGLALLVLFFLAGVVKTSANLGEIKRPEHALKLFLRFAIAKGAVTYGLELMMAVFTIVQGILLRMTGDTLDEYRREYNRVLTDKAVGTNSIIQEKYVTISVNKRSVEDARSYFSRVGADLISKFSRLGSICTELGAEERIRVYHDFFRTGEESGFHFDLKDHIRKGHDFRDYVCPDSYENESDHFRIGNRYGRVLLLRDHASYIKDDMIAELTDLNRNLMLSIDVVPVPTDEAVKEVEQRLLGVETSITNWQRKR